MNPRYPDPSDFSPELVLKQKLKGRLLDLLELTPKTMPPTEKRATLEEALQRAIKQLPPDDPKQVPLILSPQDQQRLVREVYEEVVGLGPLDALIGDATISEIMVNSYKHIFVERNGKIERVAAQFRDEQHLMQVIERILQPVGRTVNESEPLCDASLPDGSRINVVIAPLVMNGPVMTIRRKVQDWSLSQLIASGMLSAEASEFLASCVRAKVNLIVSGATSTGKTTLVTALCTSIPSDERIISIENVPELDLPNRDNWIRMVAKSANVQGKGEIPLRELVKNALRMRPDRIILGEARGGEALDVVQAMQSGHDGFMTVLHANTASGALERLETLMLMSGLDISPSACRRQIAGAVDMVVHLGRFADGVRRVVSIAQVLANTEAIYQLEEVFAFDAQGYSSQGRLEGTCRYTGVRPKCLSKFALNNVVVPGWLMK